jgi:hypothetical protein
MKHQYKNNKTITTTNTCSQNQHTSLVDMQDWSAHVVYYYILLNVMRMWPFRCPPPNSTDSCLSVFNGSLPGLRSWLNAGPGFGWLLPTFETVNACHCWLWWRGLLLSGYLADALKRWPSSSGVQPRISGIHAGTKSTHMHTWNETTNNMTLAWWVHPSFRDQAPHPD